VKKEIVIIGLIIVVFATALFAAGQMLNTPKDDINDEEIACTADALICPDGSAVGRVGPNCEFAPCPTEEEDEEESEGILPYTSGVEGVVLLGPQCPVVQEGEECPDRPYQTTVDVFRAGSLYVSKRTDEDAHFTFSLPPGDYVLRARGGEVFPSCSELPVTVGPDAVEEVTLSCDTGIR